MKYRNGTDVSDMGRVVNQRAEIDAEGNVTTPATFRAGHFVVSVEPVPDWEAWRVTDGEPLPRIFAGRLESSALYKFPSEQAFLNAFEPQQ